MPGLMPGFTYTYANTMDQAPPLTEVLASQLSRDEGTKASDLSAHPWYTLDNIENALAELEADERAYQDKAGLWRLV